MRLRLLALLLAACAAVAPVTAAQKDGPRRRNCALCEEVAQAARGPPLHAPRSTALAVRIARASCLGDAFSLPSDVSMAPLLRPPSPGRERGGEHIRGPVRPPGDGAHLPHQVRRARPRPPPALGSRRARQRGAPLRPETKPAARNNPAPPIPTPAAPPQQAGGGGDLRGDRGARRGERRRVRGAGAAGRLGARLRQLPLHGVVRGHRRHGRAGAGAGGARAGDAEAQGRAEAEARARDGGRAVKGGGSAALLLPAPAGLLGDGKVSTRGVPRRRRAAGAELRGAAAAGEGSLGRGGAAALLRRRRRGRQRDRKNHAQQREEDRLGRHEHDAKEIINQFSSALLLAGVTAINEAQQHDRRSDRHEHEQRGPAPPRRRAQSAPKRLSSFFFAGLNSVLFAATPPLLYPQRLRTQ